MSTNSLSPFEEVHDPKKLSPKEKNWGVLAHASAFLMFLIPGAGGIIGCLIIWLLKRDESAYVDDQAKEALNFNITVFVYEIIAGIMVFIAIGVPLLIAISVFWFTFTVIGMVKASKGLKYRYPLTIHFIH